MAWYMGLDKDNKPNGWSREPSVGYIEVSDAVRTVHEQHPDYQWDGAQLAAPAPPPPYLPTPDEILDNLIQAIDAHILSKCQAKGYSSPESFTKYVNTVLDPEAPTYNIALRYQQESQAMLDWIVSVWATSEMIKTQVEARERPIPTVDELLAALPVAPW